MKKIIVLLICGALVACNQGKDNPPLDIADPRYIELSQDVITALCQGDMERFIKQYSDEATYRWNYGDSLVGRNAIMDYWKERRIGLIDTITFKNDAWLAIVINAPPKHLKPGVYVLSWADYTVTYSNGKTMNANIHLVFTFDKNDKITYTLQYLDRSLIDDAIRPGVLH